MKKPKVYSAKTVTMLAMLTAISFLVVAVIHIPVVLFLKYEPKDVIITIGGFLYGPLAALIVSFMTSLIEFLTISDTGPIGFLMNVLSSCAFSCTAAYIYKKHRTMTGAVAGLALGSLLMVALMILWNWLITPLYMGVPREQVQALLIPAFLPFNALKAGLNTALTLVLYKPLVTTLRKIHLVDPREETQSHTKVILYLMAVLLLATCIILVLVLNGTI